MNILDFIIIAAVIVGALIGLYRGFFKELASTLGLLLGAIVANWVMPVSDKLLGIFTNPETASPDAKAGTSIIVWVIVFVVVLIMMKMLAGVIEDFFSGISLGWFSHLCGAIFGALKFVCICALLVSMLEILCAHVEDLEFQPLLEGSRIRPKLHEVVDILMPTFNKYLLTPALAMLQKS